MIEARSVPREARSRYATIAIILHWLIALAIVVQVGLAWRMGSKTPEGFALNQLHKSIGVTILMLSVIRLGWRLTNPLPPEPPGLARWERVLSQVVQWGFYVIMIGLPLTGWLMVSTSRIAIPTLLFWTVPWPAIPGAEALAPASREIAHTIGEKAHGLLALGGYGLFVLHVAGALKHQVFEPNTPILSRMAPGAVSGRWWDLRLILIAIALVGAAAFGEFVHPPHPAQGPSPVAQVPAASFLPQTTATQTAVQTAAQSKAPLAWTVAPGSSLNFQTVWSGEAVQGRFEIWKADILFGPDALDRSKVTVVIDMTSAKTGDDQRDASLPSADWFDAATHPKAVFTATKFEKAGAERYLARGTLDLRGVKKPVSLPFKLNIVGDKAQMIGEVDLDRTLFGVGQGAFAATDQVSGKVVVRIQLNAVSDNP